MKKISQNDQAIYKAIMEYAELIVNNSEYFAAASEYVSPATEDKKAFLKLCKTAGIPKKITGLDVDVDEYLWKCAKAIPPINMMW